jgi:uncharacterized membrane protein YgcG
MDLSRFYHYKRHKREDPAARAFGTHLHNHWGVGLDSSCGGTGILIFLSIHDRAIYISVGEGVKSVLTDHRLNQVIRAMKPFLRNGNYSEALQTALDNVSIFVKSGEPNLREQISATVEQSIKVVFCAFGLLFIFFDKKRQREYSRVESQLSEMDRNQALALQGTYQCTSCPICLDDFQTKSDGNDSTAGRVGSDGLPLKLLRCGHVFDQSCWTEWIETGHGNLSHCPVCNQNVGTPTAIHQVPPEQEGAIRQRNAGNDAVQRSLRRFQQERTFRLARMGARYPRFVNQDQVQRWSDPAHTGSLVQDQSFVRSKPLQQPKPSSGLNHGGSGSSFGGGGSFGGRGGRW